VVHMYRDWQRIKEEVPGDASDFSGTEEEDEEDDFLPGSAPRSASGSSVGSAHRSSVGSGGGGGGGGGGGSFSGGARAFQQQQEQQRRRRGMTRPRAGSGSSVGSTTSTTSDGIGGGGASGGVHGGVGRFSEAIAGGALAMATASPVYMPFHKRGRTMAVGSVNSFALFADQPSCRPHRTLPPIFQKCAFDAGGHLCCGSAPLLGHSGISRVQVAALSFAFATFSAPSQPSPSPLLKKPIPECLCGSCT
jgi:hypothetical protein